MKLATTPVRSLDRGDVAIALMTVPGEPMFDAEAPAQGVEFVDEPTEWLSGIDCGLRDPSGNHHRITQLLDAPA